MANTVNQKPAESSDRGYKMGKWLKTNKKNNQAAESSDVKGQNPRKMVKSDEESIREKLLNENSPFYIKEAYKALRTNVTFSMPYVGCKKLIVTSSLSSEGKSTNCLNLAITFAETGAKVCVIDCDMRKPNVHRLLNTSCVPGLSSVLVGLSTKEEVIRHSRYENLDFISSGEIPPNPAELLGSDRFKEFVSEIEKSYDYVLFDSCPVNIVTDTVIVSKIVPEIVFVALQNSTDRDSLRDAVNQLEFAGAKILGFILNGVEYNYKGGYKYRYGRKYYRAGGVYARGAIRGGKVGYGYGDGSKTEQK